MSSFTHWAIAHGVHYGPGKYLRLCLIGRDIDKLFKTWQNSIIWG